MTAFAQTAPPQGAKQRAFRVEAKPEENLETTVGLKERYALLIGISKYANPALSLNFAAADAQALYKVLVDPEIGAYKPENVRLLVDDQATRKNIISAMNTWLKNRVTADDSVLIFYSGHGALGGASEAYWVNYDADAEDLASSAISNKEISSAIADLPAKRKITLIDSCFSEATAKKYRAVVPSTVFNEFKGTGVVTITASTGQQKSVEVGGHGAFTYHLLDALQGKADTNGNGVVELDEIWNYLNERVQKTAADAGNKQTPVLMAERLEHGFPVTVNPSASAAPLVAKLKEMYSGGQLTLDEMAEAEKVLTQHEGNPELRNLYKGLAENAINIQYFRQLKSVVTGGGAAPAGAPSDASRSPVEPVAGAPAAGAGAASGAELEAFRVADEVGTFDGWLRYLQQYPRGYLVASVRSRLEEMDKKKSEQAAYELARQADNEKTWQQFLSLHPSGAHAAEAERRVADQRQKREGEMNAFRLAESKNMASAWKRFLDEFPNGQFSAIAEDRVETLKKAEQEKEDAAYARAMKNNTVEDWDRYIGDYATGRYVDDAMKRRTDLVKKIEEDRAAKAENDLYTAAVKGDSLESWGAYAAKYPKGPHTDEATKRLDQLKWVQFADVVAVPAGQFTMGSDAKNDTKPAHRVEVDGFLMGRSEVTNEQYMKFIGESNHGRPPDPSFVKNYMNTHPELPVLVVTYDDALAYCKWLGDKTGAKVRLPTEAEWEYAASGGKAGMLYPWGSEQPRTKARYKDNAPNGAKTVAAALYPPTAFGLLNMSGNAAEWVMDYYSEAYYRGSSPKNPQGPAAGKERVVRGGSWKSNAEELTVTRRGKQMPSVPSDEIGFRIIIETAKK
jgi:formylglycine-generating enzyme required for sulfatase activity